MQRRDQQFEGELVIGVGRQFMAVDGTADDDADGVVAGLPELGAAFRQLGM